MTSNSRLFETEIGTPSDSVVTTGRQTLPEDLLREAAHRLGIVCLVSAGLWAVNFLVIHLAYPLPGTLQEPQLSRHGEWVPVFDRVGGAAFLISLALFWYTRRSRRSPRFLLDLALAYEVLIALSNRRPIPSIPLAKPARPGELLDDVKRRC